MDNFTSCRCGEIATFRRNSLEMLIHVNLQNALAIKMPGRIILWMKRYEKCLESQRTTEKLVTHDGPNVKHKKPTVSSLNSPAAVDLETTLDLACSNDWCRHNLPSWPMNVRSSYVLILSCLDNHMKGKLRRQLWLALLSWFILFNKFAEPPWCIAILLCMEGWQTATRGSTVAPLSYEMATSHELSTAMIFKHPNHLKDFGVTCIILDLFSQHESWHPRLPLAFFSNLGVIGSWTNMRQF